MKKQQESTYPSSTVTKFDARQKSGARDVASRVSARLYDDWEAAIYMGISRSVVRELDAAGVIRPVRIPHPSGIGYINRKLYDRYDLDELIEKCKQKDGVKHA